MTRIYQPGALYLQATLNLDKQASHHIAMVLRMRVREQLYLFNGEDPGDFAAEILQVNKKSVIVKLNEYIPRHTESPLQVTLAQGLARGEKMDFIIQKAVELGVHKIIPLVTERSNVRLDAERAAKRLAHWQSVIISACEQSGRVKIPEIAPVATLTEWLGKTRSDLCFVLSPHGQHHFAMASVKPAAVTVLIGPEGGLNEKEMIICKQHAFIPLTLGPRIFRTETASIAALTFLQSYYGDLSPLPRTGEAAADRRG